MKKILTAVLCLCMTVFFAAAAYADEFDLSKAGSGDMAEFREEIADGERLFDQAGVLSESESDDLEDRLHAFEKEYGMMPVIVIVKNQNVSDDLEVYADKIYTEGKLGTGAGRDGVLLVLEMGDEGPTGVRIYAQSGAMRYVTDRAIDQIYDEYDGGIYQPLKNGDYYQAFLTYTEALGALYRQGVQEGQYNYDPETGEKDYYKVPRRIRLWHVILALLIAGVSAWLPVASTKRKYAMTAEKHQAQYVNMAYRATAAFAYAGAADALINKRTVHIPIPRQDPDRSSGGGSGFGGGQSTMRASGGGGHHTSGGRHF